MNLANPVSKVYYMFVINATGIEGGAESMSSHPRGVREGHVRRVKEARGGVVHSCGRGLGTRRRGLVARPRLWEQSLGLSAWFLDPELWSLAGPLINYLFNSSS